MRAALWILFALLATGAVILAGNTGMRRVEEASALRCARASDGTDAAICDCYTQYGLDVPEDMQ